MNPSESDPEIPGAVLGTSDPAGVADKKARQWAMITHVSALAVFTAIPFANIIAPLLVWIFKKDVHPFVDESGKEAVNFQISITIYFIIAGILSFVLIGLPFLVLLGIAFLVLVILATLEADKGRVYRYPLTIRFLK